MAANSGLVYTGSDMEHAEWIAVDWGTTHLRAFAMRAGEAFARAGSRMGMNAARLGDCEAALLDLVSAWLAPGRATPVIVCGAAGARQGWTETPYRPVPCPPLAPHLVRAPAADIRLAPWIVPGLCQHTPPDVMRGEETQIAGFLAQSPGWDGVLCMPGTHTKWAHISAGEVVSFRTFMTGELFALLCEHSILRHSVATGGHDPEAFTDALAEAMSRPEDLAARLFRLRAADLLDGTAAEVEVSRARLSGLLIGAELAAARPYWLGRQIAVIGAPALSDLYTGALAAQAVQCTQAEAEAMTLAGLAGAFAHLDTP